MKLRAGSAMMRGVKQAVRPGCAAARPVPSARPINQATVRHIAVRVAAVEEQQAYEPQNEQPLGDALSQVPAEASLVDDLEEDELVDLDNAQEQLLAWMMTNNEEAQEEDLDEMVDYDEFGDDEYAELYEEVERMIDSNESDLRIGDKVFGTVYEVDGEGAYVDIGQKASGFVPLAECSFAKLKTPLEVLRVGMKREFIVVDREDEYGQIVLSLAAIEASVFWMRIQQFFEENHTVHVKVESANKGGLLVKYGPYEAFVPVSQFGQQITLENMEELVGQEIPVKFMEVDEERERLVFSHKKASSSMTTEAQAFKIGDVVDGVVQSVKPYGAFIDLGGATGLLHVSQISHERVTNVEKILREGDKLKVMILGHDRERGRVTLSTKKLELQNGDMLKNPQAVFENADQAAAAFKARIEEAQQQASNNTLNWGPQDQMNM